MALLCLAERDKSGNSSLSTARLDWVNKLRREIQKFCEIIILLVSNGANATLTIGWKMKKQFEIFMLIHVLLWGQCPRKHYRNSVGPIAFRLEKGGRRPIKSEKGLKKTGNGLLYLFLAKTVILSYNAFCSTSISYIRQLLILKFQLTRMILKTFHLYGKHYCPGSAVL